MVTKLSFDGVLFDLGNTLIPFTPRDSMEFVMKWYRVSVPDTGALPFQDFLDSYRSVVTKERKLSAEGAWESSVKERSQMMIDPLISKGFDTDDLLEKLITTHTGAFTSCLRMRSHSRSLLNELSTSVNPDGDPVKLGLISNAIDGKAIRSFLERNEMTGYFQSIIISEEVGMAKPRRDIFEMGLKDLSLEPERSVYVGDRYFTDVVGSRETGMFPVYTREYHTAGEPPKDQVIDAPTIDNILDLLPILENGPG